MLVDTYTAMGDWFQARATAESILEFVQIEEIRFAARQKLTRIDELELAELNPPLANDSTDTEPSTPEQNAPQQ